MCIRDSTTLCALTFHETFKAGSCYYGISDLETLATDTHKFESRYTDRLVAPYPAAQAIYQQRSPIHHTAQLSCPIIFFQGLEDRVVPPSQAQRMVDALRSRHLPVAYVTFPEEGHGFRQAQTQQQCLENEWAFYAHVFGLSLQDPLPPLHIDNVSTE